MPGVFVTASGTGVGKTFVSAGLIEACRRAGRLAGAFKPVISGFDPDDVAESDTAVLLEALGLPVEPATIAMVSPWRFKAPLSPDMAASLEGASLTAAEIIIACHAVVEPHRLTVIEGVGGVMVPLNAHETVRDVMVALGLPIVLVSPTGLGAISHLLTAREALLVRGLRPAAIVLSETPGSTVPLEAMIETIKGFCEGEPIFTLRRTPFALPGLGLDETFDALLAHLCEGESADRN